jgi:hypothetical protein
MDSINDYTPDEDKYYDPTKQSDEETAMDESVQPHDETDLSGEIDSHQQDTILEDSICRVNSNHSL